MLSSYIIGYRAREQGKAKEDNPFSKVGSWRQNWDQGWDHADQDLGFFMRPNLTVIPLKLITQKKPAG